MAAVEAFEMGDIWGQVGVLGKPRLYLRESQRQGGLVYAKALGLPRHHGVEDARLLHERMSPVSAQGRSVPHGKEGPRGRHCLSPTGA